MTGSLFLLLAAGAAVALWLDALAARELAGRYSRQLCADANLQWLDQSVALQRIGFTRIDGRLALTRRYRFEVSFDGTDRHAASVSLRGRRMAHYTLPVRESPAGEPPVRAVSPT